MTSLVPTFCWFDLFDVLIVAFLIYRFALLIKSAVATRLLAALVLALTMAIIARLSGLFTLSLLLQSLFSSALILLAVVFQSDLRRAVLNLGRRTAVTGAGADGEFAILDELVRAALELSSRKIGCLVVVERDMPIEPLLEGGTEIDAKVTSELLSSIFLPYSPIHDGAVLVQRGKLTRAGCFLPLTQNPEISKALGTRHRAALGLTEMTDSVAMVISEETGGISVVVGGRITRDLDGTNLPKVLRRLLGDWLVRWS